MAKRKLQTFVSNMGVPVYVIESHVKKIMKMATDGDFTELKTKVSPPEYSNKKYGFVTFEYKTNLGQGRIILEGQHE